MFLNLFRFGIPALMAIVGLGSLVKWIWDFLAAGGATAVIQGYREQTDSDGALMYQAEFLLDLDGQQYHCLDEMHFGWRLYTVGQHVPVYFPRDNPAQAKIIHWIVPLLYFAVGITGLLMVLYQWIR